MIKSIKDKETRKLYEDGLSLSLPHLIQESALKKLLLINSATSINDLLLPPSLHLEKLLGKYVGKYSIRINKQWRICFAWDEGHAYEIEIIDYH
jgi:proteic killer suppression protein